jgi:hypothetical protein
MWKVFVFEILIVIVVSALWVLAIDRMATEHPDYKGEDFLNHDYEDKQRETEDSGN